MNLKKKDIPHLQERTEQELAKIYHNNVLGGIINLYFMSPREMQEELGITKEELQDVKGMFQKSIKYLEDLQKKAIISSKIEFLYSIEGCDYLKDETELATLYDMGLRAILPVWNEKNKFGSGNRSPEGLTQMGKRLIEKAIQLGIVIDISHANKKTFYDILNVVEQVKANNYEPMLIASHSNVRAICDRDRNLDDEQLQSLKRVGGYLGLFTNGNFLSLNNQDLTYQERQEAFLQHLHYVIDKIGFPISKLLVSTDDMNFNPDSSYHHREAFPLEKIATELHEKIKRDFGEEVAQAILIDNPQRIMNWTKERNHYTGRRIKN